MLTQSGAPCCVSISGSDFLWYPTVENIFWFCTYYHCFSLDVSFSILQKLRNHTLKVTTA